GALFDGFGEFGRAVVAVDACAKLVARLNVGFIRCTNRESRERLPQRRAVESRERFADVKAELRIKRHRTIVKRGLNEADARMLVAARLFQSRFHKTASDRSVLEVWTNGDRTDPRNRLPLPEKITADDLPFGFCDNETGILPGSNGRKDIRGNFRRRKVGRK